MEFQKAKPFYKKAWFWILVLILIAIVVYFATAGEKKQEYVTETVQKMDIQEIVSVTGKVNADPTINMNFQTIGKVAHIDYEVGDEVKAGAVIAEVENESQTIAVNRAQAELEAAEAELQRTIAGSTNEQIQVANTVVNQAGKDLDLSKLDYGNVQKISEKNIESARLLVKDAEIALETTKIGLENLKKTTAEDIKSSEKQVESALVNLNKAEIEFNNTTLTTDKSIDDSYENLYTSMNDSLIALSNNLTEADNIVGIDNRSSNDNIEPLLGVLDGKTYPQAKEDYRVSRESYNTAKRFYETVDRASVSDLEKGYSLIKTAHFDCDRLMKSIALLLDKTITSNPYLTEEILSGMKTEINTLQDTLNLTKDSLSAKYQLLTSALLNTDTADESAKAAFEVAKNNYAVAEQTLEKVKAEVESSIRIADARVSEAENKLEQAKHNVEVVQTQSDNNKALSHSTIALKESVLDNARANLSLVKAGPRDVDLKALEARVEQAKSNLAAAQFELSKTQIIAPVDGIITKINIEEGSTYLGSTDRELLSAAVTIVAQQMKVEADVPETDITKIVLNDPVDMTLDAFPAGTKFTGRIIKIEPAETMISGVVYYRIEAGFDIEYKGVKPGMTANLEILTDERKDVLAVPIRSVIFEEEKSFIRLLKNEEMEKHEVELGLEGDLYIEVENEVQEGDEVILQVNGK